MPNPPSNAVPFQNLTKLTGTSNIFITTNKGIARLFSASHAKRGQTFSEFYTHPLLQGGVGKNTGREYEGRLGVFMSTTDLNILEFSHAYNFGQGKNVENTIKLKTFEPGMEILKKFFYMFMQEQMSSLKLRKHFLSSKMGTIGKMEKHIARDLGNIGPTDPETIAALNEGITDIETEMLDYLKRNAIGQQVYVAYGTGDDLKNWAGPFQATLGKITYDNNGMEETLTYEMFTDHIAKQFENSTILAEDKGFKPVDFIRPTIPIVGIDYKFDTAIGSKYDAGKVVKPDSFTPSIHDTIVKLISYYLHSLGIKNHLVVLPNLDLLLAKQVAEAVALENWHELFGQKEDFGIQADTVMTEYHSEGFESFGTFTNALSEEYFAKYDLKVAKDLGEKIRSLYTHLFAFDVPIGSMWKSERVLTLTLKQVMNLMLQVFSRIGMKVNKSEVSSSDSADGALVNFTQPESTSEYSRQAEKEYTAKGFIGPSLPLIKSADPFGTDSPPLVADAVFNLELPFQHLPSGQVANQDGAYYMAPLMDIVNSILQSGGNAAYSPTYFWENDIKVVDKLKEKFGSGTFQGYVQQFKENKSAMEGTTSLGSKGSTLPANALSTYKMPAPPPAEDDNYFIFGDADLINLFVYGGYGRVAAHNKVSRLESTRAWEGVPIEFNTYAGQGNYFFMDPFWNRLKDDLQLCTQSDTEFDVGQDVVGVDEITEAQHLSNEQKYMSNLYKSFFYEMDAVLKGKYAVMGHFSEYDLSPEDRRFEFATKLPDDFKLLTQTANPQMQNAINDLYNLGPIIFVANDKNANVLSYNFENDQFIFSQFFGTLKEIYYNTHLRYSDTLAYPMDGNTSTDIERSKLYSMLQNLGRRSGSHAETFRKVFGGGAGKYHSLDLGLDVGRLATDMADIMILESAGSTRYSPIGRKSAALSMVQLFLSLFKHQYRGSITTLPMFEVANMGVLTRPALVLFRSTGRVNTYSESTTTTMDFFTGLYKILGFRHSISNSDAKSEFFVYKDIAGMLG